MKLWRRRSMPVPTTCGWLLLLVLGFAPIVSWAMYGERYLAATSRVPANVLIVEAWLNEDAATAAMAEFSHPGSHYDFLVVTGGLTGERWSRQRWHEVEIVRLELQRLKFPADAFIPAEARDVETQRTYESALAARKALASRRITPTGVNVLTRGPHGRRSRIVFQKVFGSNMPVGVVAWQPPGFTELPWWQSSERAVDFIKETIGCAYEAVFSSGRWLSGRYDRAARASGHAAPSARHCNSSPSTTGYITDASAGHHSSERSAKSASAVHPVNPRRTSLVYPIHARTTIEGI